MKLKILGTGCSNCKKLESLTREIVKESKIDAQIEKIEEISKIIEAGIMSVPALIADDKLLVAGYVLSKDKLKKIINNI